MEKLKLFGDIYDIIACYIFLFIGVSLIITYFINNDLVFLIFGGVLLFIFGSLLIFSYWCRKNKKFEKFKGSTPKVLAIIIGIIVAITFFCLLVFFNYYVFY